MKIKVTEIAFSAYPVADIARARTFYEGILGLKQTYESDKGERGHWVEYDIGHGTLGIGRYPGWVSTPQGCAVGLEVENFDEAVEMLKAAGVPFKMGPMETPVCHMVMVADPDGNSLFIHRRKAASE